MAREEVTGFQCLPPQRLCLSDQLMYGVIFNQHKLLSKMQAGCGNVWYYQSKVNNNGAQT